MRDKIARIGTVDRNALDHLGCDYELIDAADCLVLPGIIDPHEHLLGGSGESGFSTQTPEILLREIVGAGITSVAGCLGGDTTMKTLPGLLAKAKGLREERLAAYIYTGGYNVPPTTILSSVRQDILFLDEVIGVGEIAISDVRSTDPQVHELARIVNDSYVGGLLSQKAGVTHFHVGEKPQRLELLHTLLKEYQVPPACLYPTHVERSEQLMQEAIALTHQGVTVDIDAAAGDLARWLRYYLDNKGDPKRLTVSSDASICSPCNLLSELRTCIREHGFPLSQVFSLATRNTAEVLKLAQKGSLRSGYDADVIILEKGSLELLYLFARGSCLLRNGHMEKAEKFTKGSNRSISIDARE